MDIEEYYIFITNLKTYINRTKEILKIYPSSRAISLLHKNKEYKFIIRYTNKLYIEYVGLASSSSTKPYKYNKTSAEFKFLESNFENIYNYMIQTITNNKIIY